MQVRLGNVVVHADNASLQDRKVVLGRVGVPERGADIFFGAVVDAAVAVKFLGDRRGVVSLTYRDQKSPKQHARSHCGHCIPPFARRFSSEDPQR
jgi:hypothetical protein